MAANAQNIADVHTYQNQVEIVMGDGNTVPISHIGNTKLSAPNQ